jgi:hypothetical protein
VEVVRHVVVRVEAGGSDDVDVGLGVHALDPRDVAAQPDDREVDDGVDAVGLQLAQPGDGVRHLGLLVEVRIVVLDLRRDDEHMFVHEHPPEVAGVDRAPDGVDGGHGPGLALSRSA